MGNILLLRDHMTDRCAIHESMLEITFTLGKGTAGRGVWAAEFRVLSALLPKNHMNL